MVCGSCGRRRVDPNGSFCDKCGSSVFVAERQRPTFRSAVTNAAAPRASSTASARAAVQSIQNSARNSAALQSAQQSARSIQREATRRAAATTRAAGTLGLGRLIRFAIIVWLLWTAMNWLMDIPEVIALKEAGEHGQFTDEAWRAAQDAVKTRIGAFFGLPASTRMAPSPTAGPPKPATREGSRTIEQPTATRSGVASLKVRPAPDTARLPPGVSLTGNGVSMPRVLHLELPRYAPDRLRGIAEGTILLYVVVRPHGEAGNITVVRSPDPRLDADAISAVRAGRFAPGQRAGQPIPVLVEIEIPLSAR
jgi:TonB family protein